MSSDAVSLVPCVVCSKMHEPETPLEHRSVCVECMPPLDHSAEWLENMPDHRRRPNEPEFITGRRPRPRNAA